MHTNPINTVIIAVLLAQVTTIANGQCFTDLECGSGSICSNGVCTNPFAKSGCLQNLEKIYRVQAGQDSQSFQDRSFLPRVCNSDDDQTQQKDEEDCTRGSLYDEEIRIKPGPWETSILSSWVYQIILSEIFGVPTTMENGMSHDGSSLSFYDSKPEIPFVYSTHGADVEALQEADRVDGNCLQSEKPCAHVIPEVLDIESKGDYINGQDEGFLLQDTSTGYHYREGFFIPVHTLKHHPEFGSFYGLQGDNARRKLAETFGKPTTWGDYCNYIADCGLDNTPRFPNNEEEASKYFDSGNFHGHFETRCSTKSACKGHYVNVPCTWSSSAERQIYWNDIDLVSDSILGYSYNDILDIWRAANATKSDVIISWYEPHPIIDEFRDTDFEFYRVTFPSVTEGCIDARKKFDASKMCSQNITDRLLGDNNSAASCDNPSQQLKKVLSRGLRTLANNNNPAYDVLEKIQIPDYFFTTIFSKLRMIEEGKDQTLVPRRAVCEWVYKNYEMLERYFPRDDSQQPSDTPSSDVSFKPSFNLSSEPSLDLSVSTFPSDASTDSSPTASASDAAWINEFHYDNDGTDVGEFIEIAYNNVLDITSYKVLLYNSKDGFIYKTLKVPVGVALDDISLSIIDLSTVGIQNGASDGIALVNKSNDVIEFLSYEGTLLARNGPATGLTSTDIGVSESSSTPPGFSLQRSGTGCSGSDFIWLPPDRETKGSTNNGQVITCSLTAPSKQPVSESGVKVMAYNILAGGTADNEWKEIVKLENPDIVVFTEVGNWDDNEDDLLKQNLEEFNSYFAGELPYFGSTVQGIDFANSANAIMTRFPIVETIQLTDAVLSSASAHDLMVWRLDIGSGKNAYVIGVHLKCCGGAKNDNRRNETMRNLIKWIDSNTRPSDAVILMGDFNSVSPVDTDPTFPGYNSNFEPSLGSSLNDGPLRMLLDSSETDASRVHSFKDAFREANPICGSNSSCCSDTQCDNQLPDACPERGYTYVNNFNNFDSRIDFIIVNQQVQVTSNATAGDLGNDIVCTASDHLPVDAILKF